jgi:F0F1-type ATP synthase membrane subunit b/b'
MKGIESLDEAETLARLAEHERELDGQLEGARREAARLLAETRRTAERLSNEAVARLSEEVERLRQQASRDLERAVTAIRDETGQRIDALRRQAGRNREKALDLVLSRVAGRDEP